MRVSFGVLIGAPKTVLSPANMNWCNTPNMTPMLGTLSYYIYYYVLPNVQMFEQSKRKILYAKTKPFDQTDEANGTR